MIIQSPTISSSYISSSLCTEHSRIAANRVHVDVVLIIIIICHFSTRVVLPLTSVFIDFQPAFLWQQSVNRRLAAQSRTFRSLTLTTCPRACRAAVTNWNQRRNSINSDNLKVPAN